MLAEVVYLEPQAHSDLLAPYPLLRHALGTTLLSPRPSPTFWLLAQRLSDRRHHCQVGSNGIRLSGLSLVAQFSAPKQPCSIEYVQFDWFWPFVKWRMFLEQLVFLLIVIFTVMKWNPESDSSNYI